MSVKIPYVISEANPDYKRPYLHQEFGTIDEKLKDTFFIEKVAEFICDRCDYHNIQSVNDINDFFDQFYDDYYMENSPWEAKMCINGDWECVNPANIEVFESIQRMKKEIETETDNTSASENESASNKESSDYEEELLNMEFTDEEKLIQMQMKEYMESELEQSELEEMSTMNQTEQIIYILSKCMLNISSNKYKKNRELFYKFLNIILRITETDISLTTEEMTKNHDEKISLKLNYLMNVYNSLLIYKNIYNNL